MMSFMPDELVWAMQREREREARNVLPHTERKPDAERSTLEQERNRLRMTASGRHHQRRRAVRRCGVDVGARVQQSAHDLVVRVGRGIDERRPA